jgi:protein-tyrosine-phosphatase
LDLDDAGSSKSKPEIRNPKLEILNKFKIEISKHRYKTFAEFGFVTLDIV